MTCQKGICNLHGSSGLLLTSAVMLPDAVYDKRGCQLEYRSRNDGHDGLAITDGAS